MMRTSSRKHRRRGFTLMEIVLSMALMAMLAYALYTAMHIAIIAKRSASDAVEPTRAVSIAADIVRQDLESVPPPTGILAGAFQGSHVPGPGGDNDTLTFYSIGEDIATIQREQLEQQQPLQQEDPLAEGIRKIELGVVNDPSRGGSLLVRRVTRNLMPSTDPKVEEEVVCRDVRSFSLRYFDGTNWQEDWDSTVMGDVLPLSVALTVELNDPANPAPAPSRRHITRVVSLPCAKELDLATSGGGAP